ncbi:hypothetical protein IMY05_005G0160200 [Salix suchowensis]|nr:hypothetical protein IMY05_005G0160200 [Salix suchowensis]
MKTRDHRTSERAMTLASHVQIVKDVSRAQATGPYTPFRQNEWTRKISSTFSSSITRFPLASSFFHLSPMVIVVDNKKPRVFKQLLSQSVISPCACEHREGDGDDDDDGVDVAPAA